MMNRSPFEIFPQIQTPRLTLRRLTTHDLDEFIGIAYVDGEFVQSVSEVRQFLVRIESSYRKEETINWGLVFEDELIGACGYYRGFENQIGELGYVLKKGYRRQGLMREAAVAILQYGFDKLDLKRIIAYTAEDNLPSVGLLTRLGFKITNEKIDHRSKFELVG